MSDKYLFQTTYTLDKAYYIECFEQSMPTQITLHDYRKAIVLCFVGMILVLFTDLLPYAAWFIFVLGIVEALSVRYRKPWWITRQMFSRAANSTVSLTIDNHGFTTTLIGIKRHTEWREIDKIERTEKGWLLISSKGKQYICDQHLSREASALLETKSHEEF